MKNILVISFDIISPEEPPVSLSVASVVTFAKMNPLFEKAFRIYCHSFNLEESPHLSVNEVVVTIKDKFDLACLDIIAISCYVWSEFLVNPLIAILREEGYKGVFLLGGYQIQYSESLKTEYPNGQIFIKGYAEKSFLRAVTEDRKEFPLILNDEPDFKLIPSPYLTGEIPIKKYQGKVRLETKRGCPYRCGFCSHRDLQRNKVYKLPRQKVLEELKFFKINEVRKVNIVDPVFNTGFDYLWILRQLIELDTNYLTSLQTRFEQIRGDKGKEFLDLCTKLNVCLEFGLQSIITEECDAINRPNDIPFITRLMETLNERGIQYEVSLIYGLPRQTLGTFEKSIEYLRKYRCNNIKAFPLMLLKGTELWNQKDYWGFVEESIDPYHVPVVVKSNSFSENEWGKMQEIVESLGNERRS